jgi:type II secretory pathway pseudopilin PulG
LKSIVVAAMLSVAMLAAAPAITHAQEPGTRVTRAQVRQELADLASVGYRAGGGEDPTYPAKVQDAMQKLAEKRAAQSAYGAGAAGSSQSGAPGTTAQ